MNSPTRAVLVRGNFHQALACSRSLKLIGDQTPRFYQGSPEDDSWKTCFAGTVSSISEIDADQVLVLHAPMIAFKRVGPIFDAGLGEIISCQAGYLEPIDSNMILLENSERGRQALSDLERGSGQPHLLARHYQFIVTSPGSPKVDVRRNQCELLVSIRGLHLVRPHLWSPLVSNEANYRRECSRLSKLSAVEQRMSRGQIAPLLKTKRSLEKRVLKLMGKL